MIKEKEVIVSINPSNHEHFKNLGYNGKFKDQIKVNVLHLLEHSNVYITAICDNPKCKKEFSIRYSDYKSALIKETQEYYCNKCTKIRRHKVAEIKNNKGLLKRGQLYYFNFIENVICEIKKYLKKYKTFEHLPTNDGGLYQAILYYSKNIYEFA